MTPRVKPFIKTEWSYNVNSYLMNKFKFGDTSIVTELEQMICEYTGSKYALAVNSATNALMMTLMIFNFEPGDEIILPNYGHPAALNCVRLLGLLPIFVDIKEETLSIDPDKIEVDITKRTKAIIQIQNNAAMSNDLNEIKVICEKHNILFIEDSSPSFGQRFGDVHAGTTGDIGIFSFSETKSLFAGEGAVIITDDSFHYERLKELRHTTNYVDPLPSSNFNLSVILAAFLIPQFESLSIILAERERVHNTYLENDVHVYTCQGVTNYYPTMMYLAKNPQKVYERLTRFGIETRFQYYPLFNRITYDTEDYDVSVSIRNRLIDLPFYVGMLDNEIKMICNVIKSVEK